MSRKSKIFIFVLAIVTILLLVFVILSSKPGSKLNKFFSVVGTPVRYVQKLCTGSGNSVGGKLSAVRNYDKIKDELEDLREKSADYAFLESEKERLERDNEELRKLLEMEQDLKEYKLVGASVIANDVTDWFDEITISVGTANGVSNGDVVICGDGLIGIVYNAGLVSSKVRCVTDEQNTLMCRIKRSDELVRVSGTTNENYSAELRLDRIPDSADLFAGDIIVTADSAGAYPGGIVVGTVTEAGIGEDGIRYGTVKSSVSFSKLYSVSVLVQKKVEK